jgi:ketosteroid isomerase-like protein
MTCTIGPIVGFTAPSASEADQDEARPANDVDGLVATMDEAVGAYIRGDVRRYLSLFDHPDDYSLMPPYGGETIQGYAPSEQAIEETSRFFVSGEGHLELQHTYTSGDLVVLVAVERQHGEMGDFPDQDLSLRVTLVFRRAGDRWELVHRHADPLVHQIPMSHLAELARGLELGV